VAAVGEDVAGGGEALAEVAGEDVAGAVEAGAVVALVKEIKGIRVIVAAEARAIVEVGLAVKVVLVADSGV
jgi:hypothetical protein